LKPTIADYLENHPKLKAATDRLAAARAAMVNGNRWGETRRFAGKRAGNRLSAIERAHARWSKTYDVLTREYYRKYGAKDHKLSVP
jgi:hypothetical protein